MHPIIKMQPSLHKKTISLSSYYASNGFSTIKPWFSPWVLVFSDEEQYLFSCSHFLLCSLHKQLKTAGDLEGNPVLVEM